MTTRMARALRERRPLALLAEIDHPDGVGRFWSGLGPLRWNDVVWTGSGLLGTIAPISHTSDIAIQEIKFTMSGVAPDVAAQLNGDVRNRPARVWLACIGKGGLIVPDPYLILDSTQDYQSFEAGEDGGVAVSIIARSGFYTLERAMNDVWSAEDAKLTYPDETGFDLISSLVNADFIWKPAPPPTAE